MNKPSMPYEEMKRKLIRACDSYYNKSFSEMTDEEFDLLKDEFREFWPEDPFLKTIGSPVSKSSKWESFKHNIPMYSCNKVNTILEFEKWMNDNKISEKDIIISEKLDGISIALYYNNGKLIHAVTRGDGCVGEDILSNVIQMQNVKTELHIPYNGSLRGEIILKNEDFKSVNLICETRKEKEYQNVRNGASGIAKGEDGKYTEYLYIEYYYADYDYYTGDIFNSKKTMFNFIEKDLGLKTCKHYFGNIETAKIIYNEYEQSIRAELNHAIDGLIIEPDDLKYQKELGMLHENLRGRIAWKFTSEKAKTKVKDVVWQLGNSGRLTPVIIMEKIELGGSKVQRASVHNLAMFKEFNLHVNDTILVEKANDVIPQLCKNLSDHPANERYEKLKVIDKCPACGEELFIDGVYLVCNNSECIGGKLGNLRKWVKKLDLKGIASATVEHLYNAGLVETPADLYRLEEHEIAKLDGFGKSSSENIIETINSKKELTFGEFIGGLNIPNFSSSTAELLERNGFNSVEKILNAQELELTQIKGIGLETAKSILKGIQNKVKLIEDLKNVGIFIKKKNISSDGLVGKNIVFTGTLNKGRKELQDMAKNAGAFCPSSVSKNTDYLVIPNLEWTSSKVENAQKFGVKLISEEDFLNMI